MNFKTMFPFPNQLWRKLFFVSSRLDLWKTMLCMRSLRIQHLKKTTSQLYISFKSVYKIFKQKKFHPFKIYLLQEMYENDWPSSDFNDREDYQGATLLFPLFYILNRNVNHHICHYWIDETPNGCQRHIPKILEKWMFGMDWLDIISWVFFSAVVS